MLSRTRPKSQPPAGKSWHSSSPYTTAQSVADRLDAPSNKLSALLDTAVVEEASKKAGNLLLNSSSSSSSSSLASSANSSSLSLSTSSSTSTVLAALDSFKPNQRAMQKLAKDPSNVKPSSPIGTSEEEDQAVPSSAASSSSSSSGLSSMSSSLHNPSQLEDEETPTQQQACSGDHDRLVGECLSDLVRSVVAEAAPIERKTDASNRQLMTSKSFQLHKAVLTQTKSSTSASSEDEDVSGHTPGSNEFNLHKETTTTTRKPVELRAVCLLELSKSQQLALLHYGDESTVIRLARRSVPFDKSNPSAAILVAERGGVLMWRPSAYDQSIDVKASCISNQLGLVELARVVRCLVDRELLVWIVADKAHLESSRSRTCEELETTLDDIALALDEPIRQDGPGSNLCGQDEGTGYLAIVWICSSDEDARVLKATFDLFAAGKGQFNGRRSLMSDRVSRLPSSVSAIDQLVSKARSSTRSPARDYRPTSLVGGTDPTEQVKESRRYSKSSETATRVADSGLSKLTMGQKQQSDGKVVNHLRADDRLTRATSVPSLSAQADQQDQLETGESDIESVPRVEEGVERSSTEVSTSSLKGNKNRNSRTSTTTTMTTKNRVPLEQGQHGEPCVQVDCEKKDKRALRKATSGLDLSHATAPSTGSAGLASYYRNVASKVISNGQSKIRSFKDEMIKLNNRMPLSSSSSASRRRSMVILQSASSNGSLAQQAKQLPSEDRSKSRRALSLATNKDQRQNEQQDEENHQQRRKDGRQQVSGDTRPRHYEGLILSCSDGSSKAQLQHDSARDRTLSNELIPSVRPRTSILKNRQVECEESTCDINNNQRGNKSAIRTSSLKGPIRPSASASDCYYIGEQQQSRSTLKSEIKAKSSSSATKPKSILKTSKSVSNPSKEPRQQLVNNDSSNLYGSATNHNNYAHISNARDNIDGRPAHLHDRGVLDVAGDGHHDQNHNATERTATSRSFNGNSRELRRSTCSVADFMDPKEEDEDRLDEESNEESAKRERAFERLRSRASCYDITRLMSKNGLQSQLYKLRSGSTNTVSGKLRQRQPAQLLLDSTNNDSQKSSDPTYDDVKTQTRQRPSEPSESSTVIYIKRSSELPDGQASTGAYHEQSRATTEDNSTTTQCETSDCIKKSEFDPRSLRRIPTGGIKTQSSQASSAKALQRAASLSRRSTSVSSDLSEVHRKTSDGVETSSKSKRSISAIVGRREARESVKDTAIDSSDSATEIDENDELDDKQLAGIKKNSNSVALSKSGPFNLLRQSFNQKTLSSMLKFPTRASMRIKTSVQSVAGGSGDIQGGADKQASEAATGSINDKSSALAIAEANLLAAKQLKQQAQRLKEQQKREQQQQSIEATELMMAAVQYNQQVQRQQQHQQLFYQQQQQYVAARGHLFDPSAMQLAQQQMFQQFQRQQQQLAYIANLNSAQYMQQMTSAVIAPSASVPMVTQMSGQPLVYMPTQHSQLAGSQAMVGSYQKRTLGRAAVNSQQMMPMAVNHHSSFNIVYTGSASASQIPQLQQGASFHTYGDSREDLDLLTQHGNLKQNQAPSKIVKSSLGASMRKTVKSILVNKLSSNNGDHNGQTNEESTRVVNHVKLKSALKTSTSRDLVLNSEGSDGDGSSSDSTTAASNTLGYALAQGAQHNGYLKTQVQPKSALKKTSKLDGEQSNHNKDISHGELKSQSGAINKDSRQLNAEQESRQRHPMTSQTLSRATARKHGSSYSTSARKNVRFYLDS